jgi:acetylornithine deacetylase/succinyl-diaminopimelate desuccinylase-like protein
MDLNRWIDHTLQIQAIPAPTFSEAQRAAYMKEAVVKAGLSEVELDDLGNVYARIAGGEAAPLVITAHLDTVFPLDTPLEATRSDRHLAGPGIGDNSVALSALIELAHDLPSAHLAGDAWLVANICEEGLGNLRGMKHVVERFADRVSAYIVLEGMVFGHIYHRGLPVKRYRIRALTSGGHSWIHAGRASAVHTLMEIGAELLSLPLPTEPRTTLNIGSMHGGTTVNTIAATGHIEIDLRSDTEEKLAALARQVERIAQSHRKPNLKIEVEEIGERPGGSIAADHPLVRAAYQAMEQAGEEIIHLQAGSTDASVPLSRNIPAVCVGLTRGSGAHSLEERIEIDPMPRGYAALLDLIHASFYLNAQQDSSDDTGER